MFFLAGQSQAVTSNTNSEPVPASVAAAPANVFIWNSDLTPPAFEQYQTGLNSAPRNGMTRGAASFGPEAEIARAYAASGDSRPLCIVKLGRPTSALQEAARSVDRGIWDPTLPNEWASVLKGDRDAAIAALGSRTINYLGALWDQGQNDGNNATAAATYGTALDAFHTWFRANILGGSTATFVVARLEDAIWTQRATVRAAQAAFYDRTPNTQLFSSDSLATGSDNVHFSAASTVERGARTWALLRPGRPASLIARFSPSVPGSTFSDTGGTTPSTTGSAVSRYQDADKQPGVALIAPAGAPVLATDSLTGRPVLNFAGGSKYLTSASAKFVATATGDDNPITIVAAIRRGTADSGSRAFFGWARKSTTSDYIRAGYVGADGLYSRTQNNTQVATPGLAGAFPADQWYVVTWIFSGQTATLRVNGVNIAVNAACDAPAMTLEEFSVGAVYAVANNGYVNSVTGALDEFRLFNVGSLTTEVQIAEAEIAAAVGVGLAV